MVLSVIFWVVVGVAALMGGMMEDDGKQSGLSGAVIGGLSTAVLLGLVYAVIGANPALIFTALSGQR